MKKILTVLLVVFSSLVIFACANDRTDITPTAEEFDLLKNSIEQGYGKIGAEAVPEGYKFALDKDYLKKLLDRSDKNFRHQDLLVTKTEDGLIATFNDERSMIHTVELKENAIIENINFTITSQKGAYPHIKLFIKKDSDNEVSLDGKTISKNGDENWTTNRMIDRKLSEEYILWEVLFSKFYGN